MSRGRQCPGYRNLFDAVHKLDNPASTERKLASAKSSSGSGSPSSDVLELRTLTRSSFQRTPESDGDDCNVSKVDDLSLMIVPSRNVETESIYWFFRNYVSVPRDPTTNIFIEHILPLYSNAPAGSALSLATNAIALEIMQMWFSRTTGSHLARKYYGQAMLQLTETLQDEVESKNDDTLATVFMFDFYDGLRKRFAGFIDSGAHQTGAIALLRHRGKKNFENPTARRMYTAIRSRHISYALEHCKKVMLEPHMLDEDETQQPATQLDFVNAALAELNVYAEAGPKAAGINTLDFYQLIMAKALLLDRKLQAWRASLPLSWQPVVVPISKVHPSIRAAGVYKDMVEVYSSLEVSHVHNAARSSHFNLLRMIELCQRESEAQGQLRLEPDLQAYLDQQTQTIIDGFCASIPYHLGNRTVLTLPHERCEYPPVPPELRRLTNYVDAMGHHTQMTMKDHSRAAAAIGGWFLITPLVGFLSTPLMTRTKIGPPPTHFLSKIRPGQLEWIRSQLVRIKEIYLLPQDLEGGTPRMKQAEIPPIPGPDTGKAWKRLLWAL
ncbi:hypothetical protein LTR84_007170 [Exophiala bonariae]|uniref:Uncharacterized protein n=1 Tax=Exophiala bonariae TaxID=1690606 RepID=A0AAV9N2D6_9EURO|nr:hypothetical protein LTR84_007170 [Exophiala bonariae]